MHVSALKVPAPTEGYLPSDFELFPFVDWDDFTCPVGTPLQ